MSWKREKVQIEAHREVDPSEEGLELHPQVMGSPGERQHHIYRLER